MSEIITSSDYFKINGISSDEIGVYVDTPPVPPMARRRYSEYSTGWDEDSSIPEDTWDNISYYLNFYTFFNEDFDNSAIYAFFKNPVTLETSRFPDKYYKIRTFGMSEPEFSYDGSKINYRAEFTLAPFKYGVDNEEINVANGDEIANNGTIYSRPILKVKGLGHCIIECNGQAFEFNDLSNSGAVITIDSQRRITYIGNTLINMWTNGKYPLLSVGDNLFNFSNGITEAKIIKNERWL